LLCNPLAPPRELDADKAQLHGVLRILAFGGSRKPLVTEPTEHNATH
jgi:hypothetical protein